MSKNSLKVIACLLVHFLAIPGTQLTAKDATEGPCLSPSELLPHLVHGANLLPFLAPTDYYLPMASQALYRHYAEGLLGREAANQTELDAMQVVLHCVGPLFSVIQNKGYEQMANPSSFSQVCPGGYVPPRLPKTGFLSRKLNGDYVQALCLGGPATRPDGSSSLLASPSFSRTVDSVIWANPDETLLLTYRCPADGIKDYKVISKTKILNQADIDQVKEKVLAMGFKEDHIAFMSYD